MPTLILTPRYTDDSQSLWKAAAKKGWEIQRLIRWDVPEHLRQLQEPVFYGEALFGPTLAEQLGVTLIDPPEDWLVTLPVEYRLRDIQLTSLGMARANKTPAFVKPPNDKSFPAKVYRGSELPAEYPDEMPVLVSEVVTWEKEFRCFVLDRKLKTFSVYSRHGELQHEAGFASTAEEAAEVEAFVSALLADARVAFPEAVVLDIGKLVGGGWACVELNAAWGAGIYGCEPEAVLEVVRRASVTV